MSNQNQDRNTSVQETPGDIILEVKDLRTYLFTKKAVVKAVDGVSFNLRKGETFGIVGESGSGKSTTALSLLRMEPKPAGQIVGGEIWFHGENILEKSEKEMRKVRGSRISMILQDPQTSLNPVFTIGNQVAEAFNVQENRKERGEGLLQRVIELLRKVNIAAPERRCSDYPHQMSGGMKQRVVGAISISCAPDIVIADEPTSALDLTIQAQYLRLLREIQEATGISIIFITHDFGIVAKMCDRVAIMYSGKIVERGLVRAIFNQPMHPYTQALMNSVPRLEEHVDRLFSIPGHLPAPGELPDGCRFSPRCSYADERCHKEYPPTFTGETEQAADCWRLEDPTWKPKPYSK